MENVEQLVLLSNDEKLQFAYQLHDHDSDGRIEKEELFRLITASLKENNLDFPSEQITNLVDILILEADTDKNGEISFEEFKNLVGKHPDLLEAMAVSPVSWLNPRKQDAIPVSLQQKRGSRNA